MKTGNYFQKELEKQGVFVRTFPLSIGDMCWVAQKKPEYAPNVQMADALVLDYIIERKSGRSDDLRRSVIDSRYRF